jgi:hypothetical protein
MSFSGTGAVAAESSRYVTGVLHSFSEAGAISGLLIFNVALAYHQECAGGPSF